MPGGVIRYGPGSVTDAAMAALLTLHYLRRRPPMSHTFEWWGDEGLRAVLTLGTPASRHMQISALPNQPGRVIELNRLWVRDGLPKGTASWFIARCLRQLPAYLVVSYADTSVGHTGTVYRAANFNYAGWTDMDRKTPRFDYVDAAGGHSRNTFRRGEGLLCVRVRRRPKIKFWVATGDRRSKRSLEKACGWPSLSWAEHPAPSTHERITNK